jgi:hypothetical protein
MEKKIVLDQPTGATRVRLIINNNKAGNVVLNLSETASKIKFTGNTPPFEKKTGTHTIPPDNYVLELIGNGNAEIKVFSVNVYYYDAGGTQPQTETFTITVNREKLKFKGQQGALRLSVRGDNTYEEFGENDEGELSQGVYTAQIDSIADGTNPHFMIEKKV